MGLIYITGIRSYAYHGCLEEEERMGRTYITDVIIDTDFEKAVASDHLSDTVDYVQVADIVKLRMQTRSKLIEQVAGRICDDLLSNLPRIRSVSVKVTKLNPPINGDVQQVSVEIKKSR